MSKDIHIANHLGSLLWEAYTEEEYEEILNNTITWDEIKRLVFAQGPGQKRRRLIILKRK